MNAVRRISIEEARKKLRSYGCTPLEGKGRLNTAEWWRWPWGGAPFILAVEDDEWVDLWAYQQLIADLAKLAPSDWVFPDPDDSED